MASWPIGLSTGCFHRTSLFDCLERIRASGFSLIEVCSSPSHFDYHDRAAAHRAAARIGELGMEAHSFHAPFAHGLDISSPDHAQRSAALQEILRAAEAAAILQVHFLVIHPGAELSVIPPHEERLTRMENVVASLNRVAEHCRALGIRCLLENKLPHLLFGRTSDILWILDALDGVEIGACLDTGHASLAGDLSILVKKLGRHLRLAHVHDNRGHGDDHLPPGDGIIDWEMVIDLWRTEGFHGALILELGESSTPDATLDNARRGRRFIRQVCRRRMIAGS